MVFPFDCPWRTKPRFVLLGGAQEGTERPRPGQGGIGHGTHFAVTDGGLTQAVRPPKTGHPSTVEVRGRVKGGRPLTGCQKVDVFRITTRGTSVRGTAKLVQTTYSVPSC